MDNNNINTKLYIENPTIIASTARYGYNYFILAIDDTIVSLSGEFAKHYENFHASGDMEHIEAEEWFQDHEHIQLFNFDDVDSFQFYLVYLTLTETQKKQKSPIINHMAATFRLKKRWETERIDWIKNSGVYEQKSQIDFDYSSRGQTIFKDGNSCYYLDPYWKTKVYRSPFPKYKRSFTKTVIRNIKGFFTRWK